MGSVFLVLLSIIGIVAGPADINKLSTLTNEIFTSLNNLFNVDDVSNLYKRYNATVVYEEENGNDTAVIQSVASSLSNICTHIQEALQDSIALADSLYSNETSSECRSKDCTGGACVTNYYRSDIGSDTDFESSYSFLFARNVSFNSSAIHIPVNVHANHADVLCFIEWSSGLDDHFANQSVDLPFGVTYQYFGSRDGVLRFYPSSQWSLLNKCYRCPVPPADTFDARQRPWYTNTISGSKFVVILIDTSGSMTGSRLALAQLAAKQILESLTSNDYFLVIKVADNNATRPLDCFTRRTRASSENILVVTEVLLPQAAETNGRANFNSGVSQAFEALNDSSECYKIIVVITDKDADHEQLKETIKQQNLIQQVRVFIFLVGLGSSNHLKWIAYDNGGLLYEVRGYSDILSSTQTFVNHLRASTPPHSVNDVFWSHYRDVFGDLVLTGSLPLITNGTTSEIGDFVGVMGIDMHVKHIQDIFKKHIVCATGYGFITDNNGQLLVHPEIDYEYIKNNLSSDDLISLDLSYFEHAQHITDLELLRIAMINQETGNLTMAVWVPVDKKRRYLLKNVTYHYAPVENTPFSVAIVLPRGESQDLCVTNFSIPDRPTSNSGDPMSNTVLEDSESVYKYLSLAFEESSEEDGDISVYADTLGIIAIKHLQYSNNVSIVQSTSYDVVDTILKTDFGGSDTSLYLLDSNGFVVRMSDDEQSLMSGQRFAELQPLVFADMFNKSIFIMGTFMAYEPKPCEAYNMSPSITTACLDSAASSMHKNFFVSLITFGLWLITDGLRMFALTTYHSLLGCMGSIHQLLSLSVGYAQSTGSVWDNAYCSCSLNLCLDLVTAVQLHPDFTNYASDQLICRDNSGATISYVAKRVNHTNLVLVEVHGKCSIQDSNYDGTRSESCLPCACSCDSANQEGVNPDFCSQYRRPIDQTCYESNTGEHMRLASEVSFVTVPTQPMEYSKHVSVCSEPPRSLNYMIVVQVGLTLGSGNYGDVIKVKVEGHSQYYAAKRFYQPIQRQYQKKYIQKFLTNFCVLKHENIVCYVGFAYHFEEDELPLLIMELMETSLYKRIYEKQDVAQGDVSQKDCLTLRQKLHILCDVAKGLDYLHTQNPLLIHRDLTARKVLLDGING